MGTEKCYRCGEPATCREHVPPRCLFPDSVDIPERDLRINLITVPSCDAHNLSKSKDDEFLMVSVAGIIGNNSIGYRHKLTKVDRALKRTSLHLLDAVFTKRKHYIVEGARTNSFIEVIWGSPDYTRLESCFEHIAFGLFHAHFKSRFLGRIKVFMGH